MRLLFCTIHAKTQLFAATPLSAGAKDCAAALEHDEGRGELSEYAFGYKAASLGFGVARPYSEGEQFDFILISRGWPEGDKLWRIQVKSTSSKLGHLYRAMAQRRRRGRWVTYLPTEIDLIVVHVVPEDSWFVLPIRAIIGRMNLLLRPRKSRRKGS